MADLLGGKAVSKPLASALGPVQVEQSPEVAVGTPAVSEGERIRVAPDVDLSTDEGRHVLGHELGHVLQGRAGRVGSPDSDGFADSPALEADADRVGHQLASGSAVDAPAAIASGKPATAKLGYDRLLSTNRRFAAAAVPALAAQKKRRGGFLNRAGDGANVVSTVPTHFRLVATRQMAVEDSDLTHRQPKVFFASDAVLNHSNVRLVAVGSPFRLEKTGRTLTVTSGRLGDLTLHELVPRNLVNQTAGYVAAGGTNPTQVDENCDVMVNEGDGLGDRAETQAQEGLAARSGGGRLHDNPRHAAALHDRRQGGQGQCRRGPSGGNASGRRRPG